MAIWRKHTVLTRLPGEKVFNETVCKAAKRRAAGVGNFWDPRYIHFSNYKENWFGIGTLTHIGDEGRKACAKDIKALQRGEMVPRFSLRLVCIGKERQLVPDKLF